MRRLLMTALAGTVALAGVGFSADRAQATTVSPAGGSLPAAVSSIGGIVFDAIGLNGVRLVAQQAASTLFEGSAPSSNPSPVIGTQAGFTAAVLGALGGGIAQLAVRVTLYDGDSQFGNFDYQDVDLVLNGYNLGSFSEVATSRTNSTGTVLSTGLGFGNETLDTGFFYSNDATTLANIFASLTSTGTATYGVLDDDPGDQYYDFSQGIDASLVNVGTGPVVTPPNPSAVPVPAAGWMLLAGLGGMAALRRRKNAA